MHPVNATIALDENLAVMAASPSAEGLLGVPVPRLLGMPCSSVLACCLAAGLACPARQARADVQGQEAAVTARAQVSGRRLLLEARLLVGPGGGQQILLNLREPDTAGDLAGLVTRRLLPLADVEAGLQGVLDDLRRLFATDLAALALYDRDQREVQWQLAAGNVYPNLADIRLRPAQGFAGRIVASRRPLASAAFPADLTLDPASYPIFLKEELRSALGVPLSVQGHPVGVLMIGNRHVHQFADQDRRVLTAVAEVMALAAQNLKLYRETSRRAATQERRRLAEEVHDGLTQHLFGLQLLLADVQQSLAGGTAAQVEAGLAQVRRALDSSLTDVRRLIARLRGEEGEEPGFVPALCDYLEYFYRMSGLEVELAIQLPPGEDMNTPHGHDLLRIVQEALTNVHRHACARHVQVALAQLPESYVLTICDDGTGFDPAASTAPGHYGLHIMRERAQRTGCALTLSSSPGAGTTVTVCVPV